MHGPNSYVMKVMGVFVHMDRMMGKHFETGPANLKAVAEHGSERCGLTAERQELKSFSLRDCHLLSVKPRQEIPIV